MKEDFYRLSLRESVIMFISKGGGRGGVSNHIQASLGYFLTVWNISEWLKNSVQMFEPFWDQNPSFFGMISLTWFGMQDFQKQIGSVVLGPNHSGFLKTIFVFCGSYFLWPLWNWDFGTRMESNTAAMLYFEDLAVKNYLFFKYVSFVCEKSPIFLFSTFDQCEVFLFKYFED